MKIYLIFALFIVGILIPVISFAQQTVNSNALTASCISLKNTNLRYNSRDINTNGEVSILQAFLQSQNYLNSKPTGYFGSLTLKAVRDFQNANNINPTGNIGSITIEKINSLTCKKISTTPISTGSKTSLMNGANLYANALTAADSLNSDHVFEIHSTLVVKNGVDINVRDDYGLKGKFLGKQKGGSTGYIVEGPVNLDGYRWWKIDYTSGVDGWSVGEYLEIKN